MARDTSFRPARTDDAYEPATAGAKNDPLAELARLIGQEDPFAKLARHGSRSQPSGAAELPDDRHPTAGWLARPQAHEPAAEEQASQAGYADPQYEHDPRYDAHGQEAYAADAYYDDGQGYAGDGYDEPLPQKRRSRLKTVAAVVGLALVGTAGVFGYHALTKPSGPASEPKIVMAEQTPTKVAPASASSAAQPSKPIYDRVDDRAGERVVPREEQPLDPNAAVRQSAQGSTMIPPPASTGSILPPIPAPPQLPGVAGTEPKKVRTETIRPNQPAPSPASPNTRIAGVPPPAPAPAPAQTAPATRSIAPAPAPAQAAPATRSIAPAAPTRTAAVDSGYVVQVASQRSEADAQASFKALQQKYPTVLGNQHVTVRRADLGEKGVYYRAQVGPFATAEQAQEMCSSLKSAGGQCLVQRN